MSQVKTAIVILNWNGKSFLERFLPNIIKYSQGKDNEIIVADNASTDDSLAFLKEKFPIIRTIILEKNYGFAGGYNKALKQIDSQYYVLLNSDVEVTEGWLDQPIKFLDGNSDVAACMPKIKSFQEKNKFEYAGAAGGFIDKLGYPFCRGRIFGHIEEDQGQYNDTKQIFWATGACFFVRSDIFHKMNGFDDDFFAHMEEIDLCWRINLSGYKIFYIPNSEVFHVGGGTLPQGNQKKTFLNYRNNLYLLYKNLPQEKIFSTILTRLLYDGFSGIYQLLNLRIKDPFTIIKAHFAFYRNIKQLKNKRLQYTRTNHSIPSNILFQKRLVNLFFLQGKKTYEKLEMD